MKKEYHGFRIEKVEISSESIVATSLGGCYTTNYMDLDPSNYNKCGYSNAIGEILDPIAYDFVN